jgi:VCBS repeat-containing protein
VVIRGTATGANQRPVKLTVSDTNAATADITGSAQVDAPGNWSTAGLNLSNLALGTLTVKAEVSDSAGNLGFDQETIVKDNLNAADDVNRTKINLTNKVDDTSQSLVNARHEVLDLIPGDQHVQGLKMPEPMTFTVAENTLANTILSVVLDTDIGWVEQHIKVQMTHLETGEVFEYKKFKDDLGNIFTTWWHRYEIISDENFMLKPGTYSVSAYIADGVDGLWLGDLIGAGFAGASQIMDVITGKDYFYAVEVHLDRESLIHADVFTVTGVQPVTGNILANDTTSPLGYTLEVEGIDVVGNNTLVDGLYGTLSINPNGSYIYTPDSTYTLDPKGNVAASLVDTFDYHLERPNGSFDAATLSITIDPVLDQLAQQVANII